MVAHADGGSQCSGCTYVSCVPVGIHMQAWLHTLMEEANLVACFCCFPVATEEQDDVPGSSLRRPLHVTVQGGQMNKPTGPLQVGYPRTSPGPLQGGCKVYGAHIIGQWPFYEPETHWHCSLLTTELTLTRCASERESSHTMLAGGVGPDHSCNADGRRGHPIEWSAHGCLLMSSGVGPAHHSHAYCGHGLPVVGRLSGNAAHAGLMPVCTTMADAHHGKLRKVPRSLSCS
eukprot:1140624-Pelagomonas_calceolata.AAC.3